MSSSSFIADIETVQVILQRDIESSSSEEPPREEWSSLLFEIPEENIKRLKCAEGLYDPGSGEICTKYIPMSASSVLRHPYYNYPAIIDPGIKEVLLNPPPKIIYPDDGQELYLDLCKEMNLCPIRSFYKELTDESINLRYYGIDPRNFRAMAMALKLNRSVKSLDLTDNWINEDGCFHIGEMLVTNITLQELNLSGCRIGPEGAKRLFNSLPLNRTLRKLNLSKNQLKDEGVDYFAKAIFLGIDVVDVNLSYNGLGGKSILAIVEAFETHNKLTQLDLSWNNILSPNAIYSLCTFLSENMAFESLDLSWNALSGGRVGNAIKVLLKNPNVRNINLSNNRLCREAINNIGNGLVKASKLSTLNISYNPLTPNDALNLLTRLKDRRVKLQNLLMDNVFVTQEFLDMHSEILDLKFRKKTVITWGGFRPPFISKGVDLREIVLNRAEYVCKKPKKNPIDIALIFMELHKMNPMPMLHKELSRVMRKRGIPLDEDLIEGIVDAFIGPKAEKGKTINLCNLIDYMKRKWPDRKLPPTPPPEPEPVIKSKKGKGKGKKGKK